MRRITLIVLIPLLFSALSISNIHAENPKKAKSKAKNGGASTPHGVQINMDNPVYNKMLEDVMRIVLSKAVQTAPERALDDSTLATLSQGVQYDQGICLYTNFPDHVIINSLIQEFIPILEDELKKALNYFPDIKGSFSGITVKLVEALGERHSDSKPGYYISVSIENPVLEREELIINMDNITWEARFPHWVMSDLDGNKTDLPREVRIDQQRLSFVNPLIVIDGLNIPLYTPSGSAPDLKQKKFAEVALHLSSSEDVRLLNYGISDVTIGLPFRDGGYAADSVIEIVESGNVVCDIKCQRLQNLSEADREGIRQSFDKLGDIVWRRLTEKVNNVLSGKARDILRLQSWCIPFQFDPQLLGVPFIGITPKYPEIITPETVKLSGAVSFSRCDAEQLQQLSAQLIQQHGTIEEINRYLASPEGAGLVTGFRMFSADNSKEGSRLARAPDQTNKPHTFSDGEMRFYTEQIVDLAEKEIGDLPQFDHFTLSIMTSEGEEALINMFRNLESDQKRRDLYEKYDSMYQRLLFGAYYKQFIKDLSWSLVNSSDEAVKTALMSIPENLRAYARNRIGRLRFHKRELFDKPVPKSARDRDALSTMRDYGLDALVELDIDIMNLILNGMAPELGQEYLYMLPGGGPRQGGSDRVTLVGGKKVNVGNIIKNADIQYGIPVVSQITPNGRLTPVVPRGVDGEPEVWGTSPLLPDGMVRDGIVKIIETHLSPGGDPAFLPLDGRPYVFQLEKPRHLIPRHRVLYVTSSESKQGDTLSIEARPSALMSHLVEPPKGIFGRIIEEIDPLKVVKPVMFVVKDGKLMVGYVYVYESKENKSFVPDKESK